MHISKQKFKKTGKNWGVQCTLVHPSCYATELLARKKLQIIAGDLARPDEESINNIRKGCQVWPQNSKSNILKDPPY